jgi:hypothetical protein
MAVPGFSITELLGAIKRSKDIWDAFFGEFDNAPNRIKELNETICFLNSTVSVCARLAELQGGEIYRISILDPLSSYFLEGVALPPQYVYSFMRKLRECEAFTRKYRSLTDAPRHGHNQMIECGRRGRDTIIYAFDGDVAKRKNDMMVELQKLNNLSSLLQWSVTAVRFH